MRIVHKSKPQVFSILAKRNYKVYSNIGQTARITERLAVVQDTGVGSSFLPEALSAKIRKLDDMLDLQNASGKSVSIVGTIELIVQIGKSTQAVTFIVAEKLETYVILCCDFFDIHVEAINVEL